MANLKQVSDAELRHELALREAKAKLRVEPVLLPNPDFRRVVALMTAGVREAQETGRFPKDFKHYVYEAALEAIYGHEFWAWYNALESNE